MSCERYWREGIVLVERGLDDPHRDGCEDCTRAHASRQELIEALPLIGTGSTGDPHWQAKVWQRIDGGRVRAPWRWRWQLSGALTVVCIVALWIGLVRGRPDERQRLDERSQIDERRRLDERQRLGERQRVEIIAEIEIMKGGVPMRSSEAHVDDRLRVTVGETSDVWIYRAGRLVLQCRARQVSDGCAPTAHGMIVEILVPKIGTYQVIVTATPVARLPRGLDEDRAALEKAGPNYVERTVQVR